MAAQADGKKNIEEGRSTSLSCIRIYAQYWLKLYIDFLSNH
jgi:hypothetical protein